MSLDDAQFNAFLGMQTLEICFMHLKKLLQNGVKLALEWSAEAKWFQVKSFSVHGQNIQGICTREEMGESQ
jgi:hypothetical protein